MSLLTVVTSFCERVGLPVPTTVMGSTDTQVNQIRALLEKEGNDLSGRGAWQGITFEATHTTLALEDQGAMTTIATNNFRYIKNNTIWDRTDRLPVIGPLDGPEWQALKAMLLNGPRYRFRIRGNHMLVNPTPAAGHTWAFEYVSWNWITDSTGVTYRQAFSADTDLLLLPDVIALQGLEWRWRKQKGFDYAEDFRTYEVMVKDALGRDGGKPQIRMDGGGMNGPKPGIWVPTGSWSL